MKIDELVIMMLGSVIKLISKIDEIKFMQKRCNSTS